MLSKKTVLFNKFVRLVEEKSTDIADVYMTHLLKDPDCTSYRELDRSLVYNAAKDIFKDLSIWISKSYPKEKVKERYFKMGRERYNQSIPLSEVHRSMLLQKRFIWLAVIDDISGDNPDYNDALTLNNRVTLFYDRATFYMIQGYESELYQSNQSNKRFF